MQKFVLAFALFFLLGASANAQFGTCEPDTTLLNSDTTLLIPLPYDPDIRPDGGITDSACLNQQYQFNFQFAIPDTFMFNGSNFNVDSFRLDNISGLPQGMTTSCTPSCTFPAGTVNCVSIYGVPTNPADVMDHALVISGFGFFNGSTFPIGLMFPDENVPEFTGEYILTVLEENDTRCTIFNGSWEPLSQLNGLRNVPNPAFGQTDIVFNSEMNGQFELRVNTMTGQLVEQRDVRVFAGENRITLDLSSLAPGIYLYSIRRGDAVITNRMIVR